MQVFLFKYFICGTIIIIFAFFPSICFEFITFNLLMIYVFRIKPNALITKYTDFQHCTYHLSAMVHYVTQNGRSCHTA